MRTLNFLLDDNLNIYAGQGSSPEWNETFKFEVDYNPAKEDEPQKLFVKVMDHDTFTDDDYLGQAT